MLLRLNYIHIALGVNLIEHNRISSEHACIEVHSTQHLNYRLPGLMLTILKPNPVHLYLEINSI